MLGYILDVNIDLKKDDNTFPKCFFDDLVKKNSTKLVKGGSKYNEEIKRKNTLLKLFIEFEKKGKVINVDSAEVDKYEEILGELVGKKFNKCPSECDDLHLISLAQISKCKSIVTYDKRISTCKDKLRKHLGHQYCPNLKLVSNLKSYQQSQS